VRNERRGDKKRAARVDGKEGEREGKMVGAREEAGSACPARPTTMTKKREVDKRARLCQWWQARQGMLGHWPAGMVRIK
jgi:hypothetical protein